MLSRLTPRFEEALNLATRLHANQTRKGTQTPYIAHLLSVSALVLEAGADEDTAIAALLHDAVEDQGGLETLAEIRNRFGERVARIVDECSDAYNIPKPPWRERKEAYIAHLAEVSPEARLVSLADKLHNARSILRDLRQIGNRVWEKFNGGKEGTLWYYRALVETLRPLEDNFLMDELERVTKQIEALSSDTARTQPLTLSEYQSLAARTAGAGGSDERRLIIAALGLAGESGEFADLIKKRTAHGHDIPNEKLADELGDVLWYIAEAATACNVDLGNLACQNVEKLRSRYPDGFSQERSRNRVV